jgi:hypothetical protein
LIIGSDGRNGKQFLLRMQKLHEQETGLEGERKAQQHSFQAKRT